MNASEIDLAYRCPQCKLKLPDYAVLCKNCGQNLIEGETRSDYVLARSLNRKEKSIFFYVSPLKLVVISYVTFGFYDLFWFYKNWTYVNEHTITERLPLLNAILRVITYFLLLQEFEQAAEAHGVKGKISPPVLALSYFGLMVCRYLPGPLSMLAFLQPLALVPAQRLVNAMNSDSPTPINSRFGFLNWVSIVVGVGLHIYLLLYNKG